MENKRPVLALDIGGGTQDLLVRFEGEPPENDLQCILPSPTVMVARRIRAAQKKKQAVFLKGRLMGGGPSTQAVLDHIRAGLKVYATPEAALTLRDDLQEVVRLGVGLTQSPPMGATIVRLGDISETALKGLFRAFDLPFPEIRLVAVQDHGFAPGASNRRFRFQQWEDFLHSGRPLENLLYQKIPDHLTRMKAVQKVWPHARVMDTGAAAILGALEDERVKARKDRRLLIVNIGNEHILAAWLTDGRLAGIFEHHTSLMTPEKLTALLRNFVAGRLTSEQVLADQGHGCLNLAPWRGRFPLPVVTGPRRGLLAGSGAFLAAPFGNMMLSGCYGLIRAFRFSKGRDCDNLKDGIPARESQSP